MRVGFGNSRLQLLQRVNTFRSFSHPNISFISLFPPLIHILFKASTMVVDVIIVGSSLVKRFGQFVGARADNCPFVDGSRRNLGLRVDFARVSVHGISGLAAARLDECKALIARSPPNIVVCHVGGNDLARRDSLATAADIFDFGVWCTETCGVDHFIETNFIILYGHMIYLTF